MSLRKVLLYGGCHALVLRDLFTSIFADKVTATLLVNFDLIRSGRSFPYDQLSDYDVVFYSPIENKGDYNTEHVVEASRAAGVAAFCFPWLEWHAYCPGAIKGDFKNRFQWRYQDLAEIASSFSDFDDFVGYVSEDYPSDQVIDENFTRSLARLRESEERHSMAIRVSDFILDNYRLSRLFLISDHPSLTLYAHVLQQMLRSLDIEAADRCAGLPGTREEPQWRWRTPIFPRVARRLGLQFSDTRWVDDEIVPGRNLDLRSYLLLYYHGDSVILGPIADASIMPLGFGRERPVEVTTRLIADPLTIRDRDFRSEYRLVGVLSGEVIPVERQQRFQIDSRQWRYAWG